MASGKKIAVIGCGVSGLSCIKHCKEEGLEPTCFEQHEKIGGTWWYTEESRDNQGAPCYHNMVTNTTKYTTCYTDFPAPDDLNEFMTHYDYLNYQKDYAKHFDLYRHIRFNTRVLSVKPSGDYEQTGCWEVSYRDGSNGLERMEVFHGVMLSSGLYVHPRLPKVSGMERFKGEMMSFKDYRRPEQFSKKRVLIIGNRFSGGDAAEEASFCADQVYLSIGEGTWIWPRMTSGNANELVASRLDMFRLVKDKFAIGEALVMTAKNTLDHQRHGMGDGKNPGTNGYFTITDDLSFRIVSGKVRPVPYVTEITETGAVFTDGSSVDVDVIVYAVGYEADFNYVDCKDVSGTTSMGFNLYKWCVPISLSHPTLFVLNGVPSIGAMPPIMELNSRWAARLFAGKCQLPPRKQMEDFMANEKKFYIDHCLGRPIVWQCAHMEEVAEEIGCATPSFWRLMLMDPHLAMKVYYGPFLPQHYRIVGPGASPLAIKDIHKINDMLGTLKPYKRIVKLFFGSIIVIVPAITAALYYYRTHGIPA